MIDANALPKYIEIGFTGEKDFREVEFDFTGWGEGTPAIWYVKPYDTVAYKPPVTIDGSIVTWLVRDEDLGSSGGTGRIQLEIKSESKTRKSAIFDVRVNPGIMR